MFEESLEVYFQDFGEPIKFGSPFSPVTLTAIVDREFFEFNEGITGLGANKPMLRIPSEDLENISAHQDMRVEFKGKVYAIVQIEPDGTGVSDVLLRETYK